MSERESIDTIKQKISKKRCSWKMICRKEQSDLIRRKEALNQLQQEIQQTEDFLKKAWSLVFQALNQQK